MTSMNILNQTQISTGFLTVVSYDLDVTRFDGKSMQITREVAVQNDSVCVLPYDPETNKVLMVLQHRPGLIGREDTLVYEAIAGRLDSELGPVDTALKEAQEEANFTITADTLEHHGCLPLSPGANSEFCDVFTAHCNLANVVDGALHGLSEEGEDIKTVLMDKDEALLLAKSGKNVNVTLQLALKSL